MAWSSREATQAAPAPSLSGRRNRKLAASLEPSNRNRLGSLSPLATKRTFLDTSPTASGAVRPPRAAIAPCSPASASLRPRCAGRLRPPPPVLRAARDETAATANGCSVAALAPGWGATTAFRCRVARYRRERERPSRRRGRQAPCHASGASSEKRVFCERRRFADSNMHRRPICRGGQGQGRREPFQPLEGTGKESPGGLDWSSPESRR
jgi:hypothetical protein